MEFSRDREGLMAVRIGIDDSDELCPNCLHLVRAVENRDLIGQAKGILMEREGCSADEAFRMLVEASQHANRKVVDIADEITRSTTLGEAPSSRRSRPKRQPSARATGTSSDRNRKEHQRVRSTDHDSI
jgi:ANTAR domain